LKKIRGRRPSRRRRPTRAPPTAAQPLRHNQSSPRDRGAERVSAPILRCRTRAVASPAACAVRCDRTGSQRQSGRVPERARTNLWR
jgi:hypothetical protein